MQLLDSVIDSTLLSAVYHPSDRSLIFKTSQNTDPRMLRLADFTFSPASPRIMLDIHAATDALAQFDAHKAIASMQETFAIGGDLLNLEVYQPAMIGRQ